jgi:hypothetical protein
MEDIDRRPGSKWSLVGKDPQEIPLDKIDLAHPGIWQANEYLPFLKRLREEAPVHYCADPPTGPYWSVTKYKDIMEVDTSPHIYSSEPTIGIVDAYEEFTIPSFIPWTRLSTTSSAELCRVWWRRAISRSLRVSFASAHRLFSMVCP